MRANLRASLGPALGAFALAAATPLGAQCEITQVWPSDTQSGDLAGDHVAIDGDVLVVGKPRKVMSAPDFDAAYVYLRGPSGWVERAKLVPNDFLSGQNFGDAVAVRNGKVLVGDPGGFGAAFFTGKMYEFQDLGGGYTQTSSFFPADGAFSDQFGWSVAMSTDGSRCIVGSPFRTTGQQGAAYIFTDTGSGWVQEAKLLATGGSTSSVFGIDVDIDGDIAVVADWKDTTKGTDSGAAYIFEFDGASWSQTARIQGHDTGTFDTFGTSCAVSGETVVIGASTAGVGGPFASGTGKVYVYEKEMGSWTQKADFAPASTSPGMEFGVDVDIDGDRLVAGARSANIAKGAAYYFLRTGGAWIETALVTPTGLYNQAMYGTSTAINGTDVVIGAPRQNNGGGGVGIASIWTVGANASLTGSTGSISVGSGGVQTLSLQTCPPQPNLPYLMLGSLTPVIGSIPIDQFVIPLNLDAYFLFTLNNPNTPPLGGSFGTLNATGSATATITVPQGLGPSFIGLGLAHAYVVIELLPTLLHLVNASNRVELDLVP